MEAKTLNRILISAAKVLISVGILSWLFSKAWQENQFQAFAAADKNWWGLAAAFGACLAAHLISLFRWQLLVRAIDLPFTLIDAMRIGFIGFFFNLFAFGVIGGDALRAYYVTRQIPHRVMEAVASVVLDRFIGLLTMFSVAAIAFLFWRPTAESMSAEAFATIRIVGVAVLAGTAAGFLFLTSIIFMPKIAKKKWFKKLEKLPLIGGLLSQITKVIRIYRSKPRVFVISFLLSLGVNFSFLLAIYWLAASITDSHPSFALHFLIEPISMVANAVPLPGGIGGMELVLDYLYRIFSPANGANYGVVVALGLRIMLLLVSAIGAVLWLFNRKTIKQELPARS